MYNFRAYLILFSIVIILTLIINTYYTNSDILADNNSNLNNITIYANDKIFFLSGTNYTDIKIDEKNLNLSSFSVSVWFNSIMDVQKRSNGFLINKGGMNSERPGYNMNYGIWLTQEEKIQGGFETKDGDDNYITSKWRYNDGKWHNAIITYDTKVMRLYIDDKEIENNSTAVQDREPDTTGKQPLRVGANSLTINNRITDNFTGYIGNIMISNKALNAQEISTIYNKQPVLITNEQINEENKEFNALEKIKDIFGLLFK